MRTTFQKRQKEMKRLEKQRAKAERRAQRKLDKRAEKEAGTENAGVTPLDETVTDVTAEDTSIPQP
jgi:hypothetical protein